MILRELANMATTHGIYLPDVNGTIEVTDVKNVNEMKARLKKRSPEEREAIDHFFTLEGGSLTELVMDKPEGKVRKMTCPQLVALAMKEMKD